MNMTKQPVKTWPRRSLGVVPALFLGIFLGGIASIEALLAPKSELWPRWETHDPTSTATIDHSLWDRLLKRHVRPDAAGINRVDYRALAGTDRQTLDVYIAALSTVDIDTYSRPEQLAFWINLYNSLTLQTVVQHYPVGSIRDIDISPGLFSDGPWGKALVEVKGEPLTLNDIEHRILRPIWNDPRIHYAVNCAALGCPNLQQAAFTGDNSETLLDSAARDFVNGSRGVALDRGRLIVSSIYVWFQDDFGGNDEAVIGHLRRYAAPELAAALKGKTGLADHRYDWTLNDAGG